MSKKLLIVIVVLVVGAGAINAQDLVPFDTAFRDTMAWERSVYPRV